MRIAHLIFAFFFILISVFSSRAADEKAATVKDPGAPAEAIAKWRQLKFGMFIHWGPCSVKGVNIGWERGGAVPIEEYDNLYKQFNPVKFDADAWAKLAKEAGMKYMVPVAKHHDGFSMFDTKQNEYNIMRSPFGRDIMKELAEACRKQGIAFGAYYSVCDWRHPDFPHGSPGGETVKPNPNLDRYEQFMCKQLEELVKNYGPLATMWFDYPQDFDVVRGGRFARFTRSLQPDILINDRYAKPDGVLPGDYATSEQKIGEMKTDRPWESCMTIGAWQWSWTPNDKIKPLKECLQTLVKVVGGDGNFLFNIGPKPDGSIEPEQVKRLKEMGQWLAKYGESIYGTRGGPFPRGPWGASTNKGDTVYVHILDANLDTVTLPPLAGKIIGSSVLTGGTATVKQTEKSTEISVPKADRQEIDTIVALKLAAKPDAKTTFLKLCDIAVAELNKEIVPFEERYRKTEEPKTHHVPFFEDSYAIRSLCVAYDMTGDRKYLDTCTHWADRVIALQSKMIPKGAYFPNYGGAARQPGQDHGDWWAADCGSIGMGILAVAARATDKEQKARYVQSVRDFADLMIEKYTGKEGGFTDGIWSEFAGEWYCSTALDGATMYLLYEETKDPKYLKAATGAMNWLLSRDFHEMEPHGFKNSPAHVIFYVFEFYAVGIKHLDPGSAQRKTVASQFESALKWLAENQKSRTPESPRDYFEKDTYMAGMPYLMYSFARQMPEVPKQIEAADKELAYVTNQIFKDGDASAMRIQCWEPITWTMMSYAEKLSPGTILRSSGGKPASAVQATFHVAPGGSDDNPGTESKPFATIEKARQAVRTINKEMAGDIVVVLHGGTYTIEKTIVFDVADSGSGGRNVIYRAAANETPVISGGRRITGWLANEGERWKAKTDLENFRQMYVGGSRAVRARSGVIGKNANAGRWEYLQDIAYNGSLPGAELVGNEAYRTTAVAMADWRNPGDIELVYVVSPSAPNFNQTRCKVESIRREGDRAMLNMLQPYFTHARTKEGLQLGLPSYVENALELLDERGEWYLDRPTKTVYYHPRPGENMNTVEVIAPAVEKLLELRGTLDQPVHNMRFEGITFRHGGWLRPSEIGHCDVQANFIVDSHRKDSFRRPGGFSNVHNENLKSPANVVCHATKSVRFDRCTFNQLGGAGLDIEFGSQDNLISGCHFYDVSGAAVQVGDVLKDDHHPDDPRKIVKDNAVVNCCIHDCALEYMGGPGVFVGYTDGTVVAHNEITRLPYTGISVGWGWGEEDAGGCVYQQPFFYDTPTSSKNNRIEMNHLHQLVKPFHDGGGIYMLGNMPGTVIRGNHVHDNGGDPGGIYLDEGSGFIEVTGNLVYNVIKPLAFNNFSQDRKATCNEHDNLINVDPKAAQPIVEKAGLESEYRDLTTTP